MKYQSREKDWITDVIRESQRPGDPEVRSSKDYTPGWLLRRDYKSPDEIVEDIEYIVHEYSKVPLDEIALDEYFYKRDFLQKKLSKFYADEYVLVDQFGKPQMSIRYDSSAEEVISKLADDMDCFVVLRKGRNYFAEIGDETIDLGRVPDINKLKEQ